MVTSARGDKKERERESYAYFGVEFPRKIKKQWKGREVEAFLEWKPVKLREREW